jgi:hypothetical protein
VRLAPRLRQLAVAGTLRLLLTPLLPHPPGFGAVQVCMPRAPQVGASEIAESATDREVCWRWDDR